MTVHIGLCNPKNPQNVGSVLRAAGCYQANAIRFTGRRYLVAAEHQAKHSKKRKPSHTTDTKRQITETIPLSHVEDMLQDLPAGTEIVCFELVVGARPLPGFRHPSHALYVFGPEDGQIPQSIVDRAHHVVYVPTTTCMNLAASVNVVLYDRLAKEHSAEHHDGTFDHDAWIQKTRDNNNRLKVAPKKKELGESQKQLDEERKDDECDGGDSRKKARDR